MIMTDSKVLQFDAANILDEIEKKIYPQDISSGEVSALLRVRTKQFLDNVMASLDYVAYTIYKEYCEVHISPNKRNKIERKVYFPVRNNEKLLNVYLSECFPRLRDDYPDVYKILVKHQPFSSSPQWLKQLKDLTNENKHRNLSVQRRKNTTKIDYMADINGNELIGFESISYDNGIAVSDGKQEIDLSKPHPSIVAYSGTNKRDIVFAKTDLSVLDTLREIFFAAPVIIRDLELIME